jgi:hypothetical protein
MDDHQAGPVETGATMDYREHEKTYDGFLAAAKWGTMMVVVLMLAMVAGFFAGGGLIGGLLLFVILNAAGFYLLR